MFATILSSSQLFKLKNYLPTNFICEQFKFSGKYFYSVDFCWFLFWVMQYGIHDVTVREIIKLIIQSDVITNFNRLIKETRLISDCNVIFIMDCFGFIDSRDAQQFFHANIFLPFFFVTIFRLSYCQYILHKTFRKLVSIYKDVLLVKLPKEHF